jgi:hypothetical protein
VGLFERLAATNAPGAVLAIRLLVGGVFFLERTKKFLFADQWGAGRLARIGIPASWGLVRPACSSWTVHACRPCHPRHLCGNRFNKNTLVFEKRLLADGGRSANRLLHVYELAASAGACSLDTRVFSRTDKGTEKV